MANRSVGAGITFSCAISADQGAGYSCGGCGGLFAASDCCRLLGSTSHRFRAKFLAHANPVRFAEFFTVAGSSRFAHPGLCSNPQPNSHRDSERSDQNHSQSNSHSHSDRHSHTHAIVARPEYHPNAYANALACCCVAGCSKGCASNVFSALFLKRTNSCELSHNKTALNAHCFSLPRRRAGTGPATCAFVLRQRRLTVRFSEFILFSMFDMEHSL
jgi:hypothetical protein